MNTKVIKWHTSASGNGLWASIELPKNKDIMLTVYRCIISGKYLQIVWHEGDRLKTHSKSEHDCCIAAMACSEKAANDLLVTIRQEA